MVCKGTFTFVLANDDGTPRPVRMAAQAANAIND